MGIERNDETYLLRYPGEERTLEYGVVTDIRCYDMSHSPEDEQDGCITVAGRS